MSKVVNIENSKYDLYIGRGSEWGNPFRITDNQTRSYCISSYEIYMRDRLDNESDLEDKILELDGKILGCHCKPLPCHGDILIKLLNEIKTRKNTGIEW